MCRSSVDTKIEVKPNDLGQFYPEMSEEGTRISMQTKSFLTVRGGGGMENSGSFYAIPTSIEEMKFLSSLYFLFYIPIYPRCAIDKTFPSYGRRNFVRSRTLSGWFVSESFPAPSQTGNIS